MSAPNCSQSKVSVDSIVPISQMVTRVLLSRSIPDSLSPMLWPGREPGIAGNTEVASLCSLIREEVKDGRGFSILKIDRRWIDDPHLITVAFWNLFTCLGEPLPQYASGELLYRVESSEQAQASMTTPLMSHYSKSNIGGAFHTDGTFLLRRPFFAGLICLEQSRYGGESILIDIRNLYQELRANHPDVLRQLERKYQFDCCGQIAGVETRPKPIISRVGSSLLVQYLRFYITEGHRKAAIPLGREAIRSMDFFEELMEQARFQFIYKLSPGEMLVFNNHLMLHGRKSFNDGDSSESKRLLIRVYAARGHKK
jgi:Taurine catabolism dioxygenase TauD, TfdA family